MTTFVGDHTCKLDAKGRVLLPSVFKRQMAGEVQDKFVIKKDIFEKCLVLYPMEEWNRQTEIIGAKLSSYNREHNKFKRRFFKGVAEVILDANGRILIPKRLLDEIEADKELVLAGQLGKIEIWTKNRYDSIEVGEDEFADLAEKLMDGLVDNPEQ